LLVGACLVVFVALLVAWRWSSGHHTSQGDIPSQPVDDPRLTAAARWPNVHPEVKYVGDEACADCHEAIARTYRQHPMGRSLARAADVATEPLDEGAHNPFEAGGFRYRVERRAGHVFHRETAEGPEGRVLTEQETEVHFAVGSGQRGRSYLINRDGWLLQSPVTWYPQKGRWNLSPGYEKTNPHFTRAVIPDCLYCHSYRALPVEHAVNRFEPPVFRGLAIGCERCHGPGELHVRIRQSGETVDGIDRTIVNPRHLEHSLREAVCQQCHLQGEERVLRRGRRHFDFRPGLPLHQFLVDFVKPAGKQADTKFVGAVEQMYASRCFRVGRGERKMGCTSCHDPHAAPGPDQKAAYYRGRCLECHAERGCSVPPAVRREKQGDNCVACHMPPTGSEVNHASTTDHRVPRFLSGAPRSDAGASGAEPPLVPFHHSLLAPDEGEGMGRDLGVALMQAADRRPAEARRLAALALPLLNAAAEAHPDDLPACHFRGDALWTHGRAEDALEVYESVLAQEPRRELSLNRAAALALRLKRPDLAETYARRSLEVNPWRWQTYHDLATAHVLRQDWGGAAEACRQALKVQPTSLPCRSLLIACHLRLGDGHRARAEFETYLLLHPPDRHEALRRWFDEMNSRWKPKA
jgi:predicted CXXCH cytochrome family protein